MLSQHGSARPTDDQLSVIDSLCALPFPEQEGKPGRDGRWSGPGYHLVVLRESQDFWDDRSEEVVEAAERELEADLAVLAATLTDRWGSPQTVALWPYLGFDTDDTYDTDDPGPGSVAPEPFLFLSGVAGDMHLWRLPDSGRWLALTIGQADPEWPFQLLAAVGETSALRP
ncbi:hypothetical protein [Streptomyces sp. 891-h]|uniref:hypothetical protein n=1 Tax=Streptomyces sp. 891-h TaxID=2720714 RepID=UPI001FAAF999|nr:hypothetical protein [Streptomyces sp. 891-h]UNZ15952.1 hypothetical protein HC362_01435 [Streptomyces sp. 891-h]